MTAWPRCGARVAHSVAAEISERERVKEEEEEEGEELMEPADEEAA